MRAAEFFGMGVGTEGECTSTYRCLVALFLQIVLPSVARPQVYSPSQSRPGDPYTISVNVDMVVLHATVRNPEGILVAGLAKEEFQVYEDGALQQIKSFSHKDIPVTVGSAWLSTPVEACTLSALKLLPLPAAGETDHEVQN